MSNEAIQLELLPTAKSERAVSNYIVFQEHFKRQELGYKTLYKLVEIKLSKVIKGEDDLTPSEMKQLAEIYRGAGNWLKLSSETMTQLESAYQEAVIANQGKIELEGLSPDEVEEILKDYL